MQKQLSYKCHHHAYCNSIEWDILFYMSLERKGSSSTTERRREQWTMCQSWQQCLSSTLIHLYFDANKFSFWPILLSWLLINVADNNCINFIIQRSIWQHNFYNMKKNWVLDKLLIWLSFIEPYCGATKPPH